MIAILREVMDRVVSEDLKVREDAILSLAMLLEKHSTLNSGQSFYESVLPTPLCNLTLDKAEQQEIVDWLGGLVNSDKRTSSMIWALTKSASAVALEYLLSLICSQGDGLDEDAAWQALIGIDNYLSLDKNGNLYHQAILMIHNYNFLPSLQRIASTSDPHLKELAKRMIEKLREN